ncbi:LOW QUALITY PROTEIN: 30S ribosomal protein S31, mitochondrial [Olea europaea var. sylvestris]|uniref:LOW QUALITY PROTEIN: 30S ribosomal protein S31, mitochondrial n=1 Tax=Olea europaea var. sylvestris TaxID=158386 RepID=UPI000C1CFD2A|nr:LOW QUALITY PROTEIN: 30S ribosomal protein S31, mitochondrial [Olea europaea var. sylvestris]
MAAVEQRFAFSSLSSSSSPGAPILCWRGDKKTRRVKTFKWSYKNARSKKEKKIDHIKDKIEVPRSTPWTLPFNLI